MAAGAHDLDGPGPGDHGHDARAAGAEGEAGGVAAGGESRHLGRPGPEGLAGDRGRQDVVQRAEVGPPPPGVLCRTVAPGTSAAT